MKQEQVTVYVPAFNAQNSILDCLESVRVQTYPVVRILVVDDGSTDQTAGVSEKSGVEVIRLEKNLGIASARNAALRCIESDFVASIDADCSAAPDWLENLMQHFSDETVVGVGGKVMETAHDPGTDAWRAARMRQDWGQDSIHPDFLYGANTVFRKTALNRVGLYDEIYRHNFEDVDISRRLRARGGILFYSPQARVKHLKRDTFESLARAFWRWNFHFYKESSFYEDPARFLDKVRDNVGYSNRLACEDLKDSKVGLLYFDFLMCFALTILDLEYLLREFKKSASADEATLGGGLLSLMDLSFFMRLSGPERSWGTLFSRQHSFEPNLYFLTSMVANFFFREGLGEDLIRVAVSDLLSLALKCPQDARIAAVSVVNLARRRFEWEDLIEKEHPLLERGFLRSLAGAFYEMTSGFLRQNPQTKDLLAESMRLNQREAFYV